MKDLIALIVFFCFSITGFIVKLPSVFRNYDKELHLLFYLLAGLFLSILLAKRNYLYHLICLTILFCFGVFIECCQEASNLFVDKRIHGNFDPEDIMFNTAGLIVANMIWNIKYIISYLFK